MAENRSIKTRLIILRAGEVLIPPLYLLAAFTSWGIYNIWGKLDIIEIGVFLILGGALYELTKFDSKYSFVQFTHPISNSILIITLLLMGAWPIEEILSFGGIHFLYRDIQFVALFFFMDLALFLCYLKLAKQIRAEKQSTQVQELHMPDA